MTRLCPIELDSLRNADAPSRNINAALVLVAAMTACHGKPPPQGTERLANLRCPVGELQVLAFDSLPAGACDWIVDPPPPRPVDYQPITVESRHTGWRPARQCSRVSSVKGCSLDIRIPEDGSFLYCKDEAARVHGPVEVLFADGSVSEQLYCEGGQPRGVHLRWHRGRIWTVEVVGQPGLGVRYGE